MKGFHCQEVRGLNIGMMEDSGLVFAYVLDYKRGGNTYHYSIATEHILNWKKITGEVAVQAAYNWTPKNGRKFSHKAKVNMCGAVANHLFYPWWKETVDRLDPDWLAVQKKLFSVFGRSVLNTAYFDKSVLGLVLEHRAAAYGLAEWARTISGRVGHMDCETIGEGPSINATRRGQMVSKAKEIAGDWISLFVPQDKKPYRALYETLLAWPGCMPYGMSRMLSNYVLERPLQTRFELLVWLAFAHCDFSSGNEKRMDVFWRSTPNQMRAAFARIMPVLTRNGWNQSRPWSLRRNEDIAQLVRYMCDYPGEHRGDIRGLARKAVDYHIQIRRGEMQRDAELMSQMKRELSAPFAVVIPQHDLPQGFTQLTSFDDLVAESERMLHCIGTTSGYAFRAIGGTAMHFHVCHNGEEATCTVDAGGYAIASGPDNAQNGACEYAVRAAKRFSLHDHLAAKPSLALADHTQLIDLF